MRYMSVIHFLTEVNVAECGPISSFEFGSPLLFCFAHENTGKLC